MLQRTFETDFALDQAAPTAGALLRLEAGRVYAFEFDAAPAAALEVRRAHPAPGLGRPALGAPAPVIPAGPGGGAIFAPVETGDYWAGLRGGGAGTAERLWVYEDGLRAASGGFRATALVTAHDLGPLDAPGPGALALVEPRDALAAG